MPTTRDISAVWRDNDSDKGQRTNSTGEVHDLRSLLAEEGGMCPAQPFDGDLAELAGERVLFDELGSMLVEVLPVGCCEVVSPLGVVVGERGLRHGQYCACVVRCSKCMLGSCTIAWPIYMLDVCPAFVQQYTKL